MRLKSIELGGFKSFARKTSLEFGSAITAIVGPNGSGKSNVAESFRFVLGEQSMKSMRGKRGEDMIWNGSAALPRSGRASVKLVFDNTDRAFNLDFDEVSIERVVHRDGANEYILNGSVMRLRDISELLSQANIGASGHHIISQGEADRVLSASSRERREMIEDALGLTTYFYKREEAERKLEKTAENMKEVESLRRELAPHLRFLQSQVKKIEEADTLRAELTDKYLEYLYREDTYLSFSRTHIDIELTPTKEKYVALTSRIQFLTHEVEKEKTDAESAELLSIEKEMQGIAGRKETLVRTLGRLEGETEVRARITQIGNIPHKEVEAFATHLERELEAATSLDVSTLHSRVASLLVSVKEFLKKISHVEEEKNPEELHLQKVAIEKELAELVEKERRASDSLNALRKRVEAEKNTSREKERELFAAMTERSKLESTLAQLSAKRDSFVREEEFFAAELAEAKALLGGVIMQFSSYPSLAKKPFSEEEMHHEERSVQQDRRRKLERIKIRLEETGSGNVEEIRKEHTETSERDAFLARELNDLDMAAEKLRVLIEDLTTTLETRFVDGIGKINVEFDAFFKLMFGGGSATLSVVHEKKNRRFLVEGIEEEPEEEATEEGVEIAVSLPHKRIKGLHMLSGGERALTSIALIFAMSQVNPPPFLILDETDAALDEANSRRYGDMIETLAKKSQLILITHNRETMSRAGILYGITMSGDGISKLLSVRFEEALAVAK